MEWNKLDYNDMKTFPRASRRVLATNMNDEHPSIDFCWFYGDVLDKEDWVSEQGNVSVPTHWMKLELPK